MRSPGRGADRKRVGRRVQCNREKWSIDWKEGYDGSARQISQESRDPLAAPASKTLSNRLYNHHTLRSGAGKISLMRTSFLQTLVRRQFRNDLLYHGFRA